MSAFLVDSKTINWIVNSMAEEIGVPELLKSLTSAERGKRLHEMNLAGIRARYKENAKEMEHEYIYKFETCSQCQVYKSIGCLLYQCEEGDVPESLLFQQMRKYEAEYAGYIVRGLPEYDLAVWN